MSRSLDRKRSVFVARTAVCLMGTGGRRNGGVSKRGARALLVVAVVVVAAAAAAELPFRLPPQQSPICLNKPRASICSCLPWGNTTFWPTRASPSLLRCRLLDVPLDAPTIRHHRHRCLPGERNLLVSPLVLGSPENALPVHRCLMGTSAEAAAPRYIRHNRPRREPRMREAEKGERRHRQSFLPVYCRR